MNQSTIYLFIHWSMIRSSLIPPPQPPRRASSSLHTSTLQPTESRQPPTCYLLAHLCDHPWGRGRRGRRRGRPIERLLTRRREVQRPLAQRLALLFLLGHVPVLVVDFHHARGVGDGWSSKLLRPRRTLGALTVVEVPVANHLVRRRSLQTTWTSRGGVLDDRLDDRFDDLLDERVDVLRATR